MDINKNLKLCLTGATGFIGRRLLNTLEDSSKLFVVGRTPPSVQCKFYPVDFGHNFDIREVLESVDVVIHCAASAHNSPVNSVDDFYKVNALATIELARQAIDAGVRRFIFISSINVNGVFSRPGMPFTAFDAPMPVELTGEVKAVAEAGLKNLCNHSAMEFVIIRPALVYGPGVKANFAAMMKLAQINLPLPFGSIRNMRSLVALDNLVDLILTCVSHPNAANQTFLVSDDEDLSTTELFERITRICGKRPWLLPFPVSWMVCLAAIFKKKSIADRLFGSLQVDMQHTKDTLNWRPVVTLDHALRSCLNESIVKIKND